MRQWLDPGLGEDAGDLALDPGRIGKGAEQIEDRPRAKLDARWADMLHRGMMRWREHEAAARFLDAAADLLRRQIDLHAKRRQHVGRARFRRQSAVAVLGDPEPGTGCDEGG